MKKQPVQKTTEELLKDLDNPSISTTPVIEEKIQSEDTVLTFLRFYNIEPGTYTIKDTYLYKLYRQFTSEPVTSKTFQKALGYYLKYVQPKFPNDKTVTGKHYLINKKMLNLSEKALELVKKSDKTAQHKSLTWKTHYDSFLKRYGIEAGKDGDYIWASTTTLFNLYDKWTYEIKRKIGLSKREFIKFCKAHFEYKQDKNTLWYKINDITKDKKSEIKARNSLTNEKEKQKE